MPRALGNSVGIAGAATLLAAMLAAPAAYALARLPVRGRRTLLLGIVLSTALPAVATVAPLYLIVRTLGLRDTWLAVILADTSFALPLIYGTPFADATVQLLILLPGVYLVSIESVLVQHFMGTGLPVAVPIFWLVTLALSLGLNFALVPTFGARGAALTSTLSYALIFALVAVYFCLKTGKTPSETFRLRGRELRELLGRAPRRRSQRSVTR